MSCRLTNQTSIVARLGVRASSVELPRLAAVVGHLAWVLRRNGKLVVIRRLLMVGPAVVVVSTIAKMFMEPLVSLMVRIGFA